ncbi:MAG: hypothetical protein ACKPKO_38600, partial [Candidatus Fonsibacter sp.]
LARFLFMLFVMEKWYVMELIMSIDDMFEEWLNTIRPVVPLGDEGISNRERYADILDALSIAFEAGFNARIKHNSEEMLQK